jgi:hypothetical protein
MIASPEIRQRDSTCSIARESEARQRFSRADLVSLTCRNCWTSDRMPLASDFLGIIAIAFDEMLSLTPASLFISY